MKEEETRATAMDPYDLWFFGIMYSPHAALTNAPVESDSRWQQWKQIRAALTHPEQGWQPETPKVIEDLLRVDDTGVVANYIRKLHTRLGIGPLPPSPTEKEKKK